MEENIEFYYQIVEDAISKIGINAADCREKKAGQWSLRKGDAKVWVDLFHIEREGRAYFQCMAPIMKVPTSRKEAFYKELLEINDKLFGVAFTIYENQVWIKVIREAVGMDANECYASITRVGAYAVQYIKHLTDKYDIQQTPFGPGPISG